MRRQSSNKCKCIKAAKSILVKAQTILVQITTRTMKMKKEAALKTSKSHFSKLSKSLKKTLIKKLLFTDVLLNFYKVRSDLNASAY